MNTMESRENNTKYDSGRLISHYKGSLPLTLSLVKKGGRSARGRPGFQLGCRATRRRASLLTPPVTELCCEPCPGSRPRSASHVSAMFPPRKNAQASLAKNAKRLDTPVPRWRENSNPSCKNRDCSFVRTELEGFPSR